jgi:hypothetical protein
VEGLCGGARATLLLFAPLAGSAGFIELVIMILDDMFRKSSGKCRFLENNYHIFVI